MITVVNKTEDGVNLILLGLTYSDMQQMISGNSVYVEGEKLGLPKMKMMIIFGKTDLTIMDEIRTIEAKIETKRHRKNNKA